MGDAQASGVERKEIVASGPDGDVRCLVYIPENANGSAYLHIHGGGYFFSLRPCDMTASRRAAMVEENACLADAIACCSSHARASL